MAASDQRVIATAGILSVAVGSANSIVKNGKLPSTRFLLGSGVAYLILTALAEGEPELAKGLAMGVLTTVLLGEGGGVLTWISNGEIDTQKPKKKTAPKAPPHQVAVASPGSTATTTTVVPGDYPNGGAYRPDAAHIPGIAPRPAVVIHTTQTH